MELFGYGKIFADGKIKSGKKVLGKIKKKEKKKEKTGPKKKERVPFCKEKKKFPLQKRLVLTELHAGNQNFSIHTFKNEVSFPLLKPGKKDINNGLES